MADLVVGLAKSVVEGALTKAQSAIEEESQLQQSSQRDLVFIIGEFEMMHSFLNVATKERVENKVVMTWVRQVRELAYDVEDCIEFVVHLDTKTRKTSWFWRMIPSWCIAPPPTALALDEAVSEIEQLKAQVKDVSTRNSRYSLISDSGSKPVTQHHAAMTGTTALSSTEFNMLAEARDAARRQQGLGDLTHLITNKDNEDPRLQVISVWGTGSDLGTTSIIRKAYCDPEICQKFLCRAWVKLMHPFNPNEFVRRFMAQVYKNSCNEQGVDVGVHVQMKAEQGDLLTEFVNEVKTKTYLVVLENLTDMVDWDDVRTFLPDMINGSWIIVSTHKFEIASLCIGHSYQPLELQQFSPEHSVCAFFKEGSQGDKDEKLALSQVGQNSSYGKTPSSNWETATYWMENSPLVGRETEMNELGSYTAKACFSNSRVVSVWGIAGIGKSALVRNFYYDRILRRGQFKQYSWVDISHPFNLRDFSRSLISDHYSEKDPIKECRELLSQGQCLIVIDDLQSKEEWDLIQAALVSRPSSSIIIVITTDASLATYCTKNEDQVFNVKGLEADAAMDLFRKEMLPEFIRRRGLVGVKVPRGIGKLTALHTLGVVNVDASGGKAIVEELKKLTQLHKLGVSGINRHNINEFFSETSGLVHLESVLVQLDQDSQGCLEKISLPWENIQSLTLYGLQDMLPLEMDTLKKLSKLDLEMDTLQSIGMEFLTKLPELRIIHLRVKQLVDGKLHFYAQMNGLELDIFEKVKILEVTCMSSRLHVSFGSKSMKNLELLKIDCSSAGYKLTGQNNLLELKEVFLKGTDDEAVKTYVENLLAGHPKKPAVKLRLQRSS
ncbi:hypothetical protein ACQ4PT_045544 [Festuca glaucescens]